MGDHLWCCAAGAQRKVSSEKADRFAQTVDLRVAIERYFLGDGRGMCADKRVGGYRPSFIAVVALYSTSIVKLRRLEATGL